MSELITLMCKGDGAALTIDASSNMCVCPYCHTTYIVPELLNEPVNQALRAGDVFLGMGDYEKALRKYDEVCGLAPQKYLGWWGKIRAETREFTVDFEKNSDIERLHEYYRYICAFIPGSDKPKIESKFKEYDQRVTQKNAAAQRELCGVINRLQQEQKRDIELCNALERKAARMQSMDGLFVIALIVLITAAVSGVVYFLFKNVPLTIAAALVALVAAIAVSVGVSFKCYKEGQTIAALKQSIPERTRQIQTAQNQLAFYQS